MRTMMRKLKETSLNLDTMTQEKMKEMGGMVVGLEPADWQRVSTTGEVVRQNNIHKPTTY